MGSFYVFLPSKSWTPQGKELCVFHVGSKDHLGLLAQSDAYYELVEQ